MTGRRILVTGGSGFLGTHLVTALRERGDRVTIADLAGRSPFADVPALAVDLLEDDLAALLTDGGFDGIFHLAGNVEVPLSVERPDLDFRLNATTTIRLLEAMRATGSAATLLLASTAAVYGEARDGLCSESQPAAPVAPYGASKWMAESYARLYAERHGLRTCRARIFSLYGPGLRKHVVHDLIEKLHAEPTRLSILGDGGQVRDFLFVPDAVRALIAVHDASPGEGEVVNVGSGTPLSIGDLARAVAVACGAEPELRFGAPEDAGRSRTWVADVRRLHALGFRPEVSLAEGLARTVAWYRDPGDAAR